MRLRKAYKKYNKDIFNLAFHFCRNVEDAEDILQDTFLKYSGSMYLLDEFSEKNWLLKVASNLCIDKKRYLKMVNRNLKGLFLLKDKHVHSSVEIKDSVSKILNSMRGKVRLVFILKFMEDLKYSEISDMLAISEGTLKSIISRELGKIRGVQND